MVVVRMYRRLVISSKITRTGPFDIIYYVRGASVVEQRKNITDGFDQNVPIVEQQVPNVFHNAVRMSAQGAVTNKSSFEFILDVAENQPHEESVEEKTEKGVTITVYNADGVVVCRNTPKTPASGAPAQTDAPGEMTSEPIDGPGEMTSVPGEEPGEMASENTDESGATI